ncbi:MAG TPA: inorganic pyrophosphatase [Polyangiaceae bacterium]|jgi:inorganic pyrophosphatase|nr:inorganic pyrophosphatase [Polyangiaceae bacterium]
MADPLAFYRWRPHPWHGLDAGDDAPKIVNAYIEITPFDTIKYEIDKATGYLRVDRPQRGSAQPPTLYGFVPRTYCGKRVAALSAPGVTKADGDPIDICVISERAITRSEIVLRARVVGGIQMIDDEEADDKIVAVLESDLFWGPIQDLKALPQALLDRLTHYFATYKLIPGKHTNVRIERSYEREHAEAVIAASMEDYKETYADTPPTLRF